MFAIDFYYLFCLKKLFLPISYWKYHQQTGLHVVPEFQNLVQYYQTPTDPDPPPPFAQVLYSAIFRVFPPVQYGFLDSHQCILRLTYTKNMSDLLSSGVRIYGKTTILGSSFSTLDPPLPPQVSCFGIFVGKALNTFRMQNKAVNNCYCTERPIFTKQALKALKNTF